MRKKNVLAESGIPIPKRKSNHHSKWGILLTMKAGESITINNPKERDAIYRFASRHKIKIAQRLVPSGGLRFWKL